MAVFTPVQINEWCDSDDNEVGQTALCPYCSIDSVLGDQDVELSLELLKSMHQIWFWVLSKIATSGGET